MSATNSLSRLKILGHMTPEFQEILTPEALELVIQVVDRSRDRVGQLLEARKANQARIDAGEKPDFLPETKDIRSGDWTVAPLPADLQDRRVEITGPVDRKMVINALNSGANVFMADFEDSNAPTWSNNIQGQINLRDAVRRTISWQDPSTGKQYQLNDKTAVLLVRPRGWHLLEKHVRLDGKPIPGGLFDLTLYCFHNARELLARGSGPYFYLPKMQHHLEARLWNDVFLQVQEALGLPRGTIKATVLIETLPAAFQMDEILHELREHSAGLNCGRWDYIFSYIKTFRNDPTRVLPDRVQVTMTQPFMRAYTQLVIKTCHRRNVHAMGGMSAFIPVKTDPAANEKALEQVRADKLREVTDGHDGTWVAHPGLVPVAREIFDQHMKGSNQIHRKREDVNVTAADLIAVPTGTRTVEGLRHNIRVGVQYIEAWLRGVGCVPLYNLMEDAATAEISRTQVWQWVRHMAVLDDGQAITRERFQTIMREEMERVRKEIGDAKFSGGRFPEAIQMFEELSFAENYSDFLTLPAYDRIVEPAAA
ncbi:MAG: Malate synthase A [Myxococcota bacterium]|nr:Malate synthase A [Myxococcota bacterium]